MHSLSRAFFCVAAFAVAVPHVSFADPVTLDVALSSSNPTEVYRIYRSGTASTYTSPKSFPGVYGTSGPYAYQTFTFAPDGAAFETVSVVAPDAKTFFSVYLNSFDPTNLAGNYLADGGLSGTTTFSFALPQGDDFILVANGVESGVYGATAHVTVTGANAVGVTPEPGSLLLMSTGLAGVAWYGMRRRKLLCL